MKRQNRPCFGVAREDLVTASIAESSPTLPQSLQSISFEFLNVVAWKRPSDLDDFPPALRVTSQSSLDLEG